MLPHLRLVGLALAACVLAGCGARAKPAAAPAEPADYDWSQFHDGHEPEAATHQEKPPDTAETQDVTARPPEPPEKEASPGREAGKPTSAPAEAAKKVSATKIAGQSLSDVSADLVASESQRATKRTLVSASVIVGAEYEQINVVLDHLAVQIVRPAAAPDRSGPKVRSPKARRHGVAQTEAAFYDASADVLVIVQTDKKATSARALAALVSSGTSLTVTKKPVRATKPKRAS